MSAVFDDLSELRLYPLRQCHLWVTDHMDSASEDYLLKNLMEDSNVIIEPITRSTAYGSQRWIASRIQATIVTAYSGTPRNMLEEVLTNDLRGKRFDAELYFYSTLPGRDAGLLRLTREHRVEATLRQETAGEIFRNVLTLSCIVRPSSGLFLE